MLKLLMLMLQLVWLVAVYICVRQQPSPLNWFILGKLSLLIIVEICVYSIKFNYRKINQNGIFTTTFIMLLFYVAVYIVAGITFPFVKMFGNECSIVDTELRPLCNDKLYLIEFSNKYRKELNSDWVGLVNTCYKDPECDRTTVDEFKHDMNDFLNRSRVKKYNKPSITPITVPDENSIVP